MKAIKKLTRVIWDEVIHDLLNKWVQKTETPLDDMGLRALNRFIIEWTESNEDEMR